MNFLSEIENKITSLSNILKIDIFTVEFEIIVFLILNSGKRIDEIRSNVRGSPATISNKMKYLLDKKIIFRMNDVQDKRKSRYFVNQEYVRLYEEVIFDGKVGHLQKSNAL